MAMGAAVEVETPTPAAPEGAPAGGGAPAEVPAGDVGAAGQPAGSAPAVAPEGPSGPGPVPYGKWAALNREFTHARRGWETERERITREHQEAVQRAEGLTTVEGNYRILEKVLRENPDIAEALAARLGTNPPGRAAQPVTAAIPPEITTTLKTLLDRAERQDRMEAQRAQATADAELSTEVNTMIGGELARLNPAWQGKPGMTKLARAFVMSRLNEPEMKNAGMEDIPILVHEFYREFRGSVQGELDGTRAGIETNQRTAAPAITPAGAPVSVKSTLGANDQTTAARLEGLLREAGFGQAQGA